MRLLKGFAGKGLMFATVCLCTVSASAEYIQFTFTGEVTEIGGTLWDPWLDTQLGDPITVQYIFDSNAEDQIPAGNIGYYFLLDLSITIGDVALGAANSHVNIIYDYITDALDYYVLSFNFADGSLGSAFVEGIDLFASDALPTDIDWTRYASDAGGVIRPEPTNDRFIRYNLTSFESTVVPAAPSIIVLLLGVSCRRRRA